MKRSNLNKKILIFALPVIIFCLWTFLSSADAQLIPAQTREIAAIRAAIKAKGAKWIAGETSVSKLPREQARMLCGTILTSMGEIGSAGEETASPYMESQTLPESFDWRNINGSNYVTEIKDQMNCGSCWAFATVGGFESQILINTSALTIDLSEQYVVSCNTDNKGCCGGYINRVCNFLLYIGTTDETCVEYTSDGAYYYRGRRCIDDSEPCPPSCTIPGGGDLNLETISGWEWIPNTVENIKSVLYNYGPVPCGMAVYEDFTAYNGGVYEHSTGSYLGGHAVLIIGYDDNPVIESVAYPEKACWICKNSWGTDWGEGYGTETGGYFRIAYNNSNIGDSAVRLIYEPMVNCSSNQDCDDTNPCTDDACDGGECVYTNNTSSCDDGDACTTGDTCSDGECIGNEIDCDDTNPCTIDSCDGGNCLHEQMNCNDNDPCTDDACVNGICVNTDPECGLDDGCCPEGCPSVEDPDCPQAECGDGYCAGEAMGEDCTTCLSDCSNFKGECCGDGICEKFESRRGNCPIDCS